MKFLLDECHVDSSSRVEVHNCFFASMIVMKFILQGGMQPIHFATMDGHHHIISALIDQYGVDPNSKSKVMQMQLAGFKIHT